MEGALKYQLVVDNNKEGLFYNSKGFLHIGLIDKLISITGKIIDEKKVNIDDIEEGIRSYLPKFSVEYTLSEDYLSVKSYKMFLDDKPLEIEGNELEIACITGIINFDKDKHFSIFKEFVKVMSTIDELEKEELKRFGLMH